MDLVLACCGLVILWPFMLIIAGVIKCTSKGPALFAQGRVGREEGVFMCLKFRTMAAGSPNVASHEASSVWITPVGRFLRRWKLDELPQLFNVVLGQMSLVGPRPCLPSQVSLILERRQRNVFSVRPGITGLAQIANIDMSQPARLAEVDAFYVRNHSSLGDIRIMISTVVGSGFGDAAEK
ncbi:sugar transferase [Rhizobium sp. C4]|uniref:sugar transferase n=1 Tax=Rhizobium sp. C4 TaxID=1349800 RepID=UPI002E7BF9B5|nr:sugar transferase [Rhizobium sp. C4]